MDDKETNMNEVAKVQPQNIVASEPVTPMQMLQMAVEQGAELDKLEKLMALEERWQANQAKKAYVEAMTGFKSESIAIIKDKHVKFTTSKGTTEYKHATLHGAVTAAAPVLSKYGLSHTWKTSQAEGGMITVSCVITHKMGHSEETALSAGLDQSGGKNNIQALSSTVSYLERYTFLAATGLTAADMDDDGRGAEPPETISDEQVANLEALIDEVGAEKSKFLGWAKIRSLDEILAVNYHSSVAALESKRKAK